MKLLNKILLFLTLLLSNASYATMYEDAEDESTNKWSVYDNTPLGAFVNNVYLQDRQSNAIQLVGKDRKNGHILGNWEGRDGAWNNTSEHTLKWDLKFDNSYTVYIRVMTQKGARYIYYTESEKSEGKRDSTYIHIGLGTKTRNGTCQTITRDLAADLKMYESSNKLIAVNAFLIRGNGFVDNVALTKNGDKQWYIPKANATWHIQLSGNINTNYDVDVYDIDLFDTSKEMISELHNQNKKVICYFSAGSYEEWREDANDFPASALGKKLDGWEGERWLDVRNDGLKKIMTERMDIAKAKGCDGVDPDNVDGYTNDTGFNLSADNQLKYNIFLAEEAHKKSLSIGLKNDVDQIEVLAKHFDFAVNEECSAYDECSKVVPFINQKKSVLHIEYASNINKAKELRQELCQDTLVRQMATLFLDENLEDIFRIRCQ